MAQTMPNPAIWLADQPREMLEILHKAAKDVASEEFRELFENEEHMEVYVRITNLPIADSLRDIRQAHIAAEPTRSRFRTLMRRDAYIFLRSLRGTIIMTLELV